MSQQERCDRLHGFQVTATGVAEIKEIPTESSSLVTLAKFKHSPATRDRAEATFRCCRKFYWTGLTGRESLGQASSDVRGWPGTNLPECP